MHARLRLDLAWSDLLFAALAGVLAGGRARRARALEACFAPDAFAALSARSGLDLYLDALALPPGSEVLVSGLTIPHMPQILAAHGLAVVPFALDPVTLAPAAGELERRATPRTRAVLFAHLFGQRAELGPVLALCRARGWLLWEDCAQAWSGDGWRGESSADLALFSFGLIKTATAIQGGLLRVKDAEVRARMQVAQALWPVQTRADFLRRTGKAAVLRFLCEPWAFVRFARHCARRGRDLDEVLHAATRGFPGPDFLARLRRAPSAPLLALLQRRLARPSASLASAKRALGEELVSALGPGCTLHGRAARERHHWVFAVASPDPAQLVRALRAAGFDATARSSLVPVEGSADGRAPEASRALLAHLVYVPLAPRLAAGERARLVALLRADAHAYTLPRPAVALAQPPAG